MAVESGAKGSVDHFQRGLGGGAGGSGGAGCVVVLEERAESETGTTGVAGAAATGRGRESQGGNSGKRRAGDIGALLVESARVI